MLELPSCPPRMWEREGLRRATEGNWQTPTVQAAKCILLQLPGPLSFSQFYTFWTPLGGPQGVGRKEQTLGNAFRSALGKAPSPVSHLPGATCNSAEDHIPAAHHLPGSSCPPKPCALLLNINPSSICHGKRRTSPTCGLVFSTVYL